MSQTGTLYNRSFEHSATVRTYSLYVPASYSESEKWPLIINYHGYAADIDDQITRTNMNTMADTAHFIIAYPQGLTIERSADVLPAWVPASGQGWCVPGFSSQYDDISFTEMLIDDIVNDFSIDISRIHTTGISLGALMAVYAAIQLPDRIASVAGVASHMTDLMMENMTLNRAVSALFIQGTADGIFLFNGLDGQYPSAPEAVSFWAAQNNCSADSLVTEIADYDDSDNTTVTLIRYSSCDDKSEVVFYRVNNGGHRWPGSGYTNLLELLGYNNLDINASSVILNFFKRNPHSSPVMELNDQGSNEIIKDIDLKQNYPNPFNPVTMIRYHLSINSDVTLDVFDTTGKKIKKLIMGLQNPGSYNVLFDGSGLPSGVYFYRLTTSSGFSKTGKMLLVK